MIATVTLGFKMIGGHGLAKPVEQLQNALSFNYYGNTEIYDERAVWTEDTSALDKTILQSILDGEKSAKVSDVENKKENNVDFYFFSESDFIDRLLGRVTCKMGIFCVFIDRTYFDNEQELEFLGEKFKVYKNPENWLMETYGEQYMIPQNKKGRCKTFTSGLLCGAYKFIKPRISKSLVNKLQLAYRQMLK